MVRGCGEGAGAQGPRASIALRSGAVGIRARDGSASRPDARGAARAPARLGHHPVGAEVGVAGGTGDGRPPRDPGSRRGGARDARLRGGGASADPGLGPGDPPPPPGEREWHGGGGVPASGEPRPGPAAAHPLRAGQHDAHCLGGMAERGADEDPPQPEADRSVLSERAGAAPSGARHGGGAAHGGAGTGVRACGLRALVHRCLLGPAPGDPGIPGTKGAALHGGEYADGGAAHAPAQGGPDSRGPRAGMARAGAGTGAGPGENGPQAAPAPRPADRRAGESAARARAGPAAQRDPQPEARAGAAEAAPRRRCRRGGSAPHRRGLPGAGGAVAEAGAWRSGGGGAGGGACRGEAHRGPGGRDPCGGAGPCSGALHAGRGRRGDRTACA